MQAGVLALVAIVGVSLWLAARMNTPSAEVDRALELRRLTARLQILLQDAETGQRGFLLTRDDRYLEPYREAQAQLTPSLERLRVLAGDEAGFSAAIDRLAGLVDEKLAELAQTIELASAGRDQAALAIVRSDRGRESMDQIRDLLGGLIADSQARATARLDDVRTSTRALAWVSVSASLLILLVAGGAIWTVTRYTRELQRARREVEAANAGLEERVQERTADLTRANEEIQRFAYIVSHDLRAPLVNILGFTSELEMGMQSLQRFVAASGGGEPADPALADEARVAANDDLPEAVGFIRASTTKMDRLINAILRLSREGRRELNPEWVNLGALFTAARASVQHQLDSSGTELKVSGRLPTIYSDRLALEQIFGNLIDNGVKYASPERQGVIEISAEERAGRIAITVADNGRGIAPGDHERIFELFRRSGAQDRPGEGIGLAHVRALVRRLGGEITVESDLGRGSSFRVTLPKSLARSSFKRDAG